MGNMFKSWGNNIKRGVGNMGNGLKKDFNNIKNVAGKDLNGVVSVVKKDLPIAENIIKQDLPVAEKVAGAALIVAEVSDEWNWFGNLMGKIDNKVKQEVDKYQSEGKNLLSKVDNGA